MKKTVKILLCSCLLICITVSVVVFLHNNVIYSKDSPDVFEHFFAGKGKDIVIDSIKNQSDKGTNTVNAYGYNISMISSIYEKETGIGYFVFEITGDVNKLKDQALGNVISNNPLISFQASEINGSSGGEFDFDEDKMYMYYSVADTQAKDSIYINVEGEAGSTIGRFYINGQDYNFVTKKSDDNAEYDCVISPFGIKIKSQKYLEDKDIIVKYKDNTEGEVTFENKYFPERDEECVYTHVFNEIKDVNNIDSVIIYGKEYKLV